MLSSHRLAVSVVNPERNDMTTIHPMPAVIRRKLNELRWSVSVWFLADAFGRIGIAIVAMMFLSLSIDRYFRMDTPQRAIMLVLMIGVVAYLIVRRLAMPLRRRLENDALALQVERSHPQLADALISALQFSQIKDTSTSGASPMLVNATIEAGAERARDVNFREVLDRKSRNRNLGMGFGSVAVVVAAFALMPGTMQLWAARNLMLADDAWPQDTHLTVVGLNEDGILIVPRGDDMALHVETEPGSVVPDVVHVDYRVKGGGRTTEQMVGVGDAAFRATFRNVLDPFRFRVRGNDEITPWYEVQLVDRPALETIELHVNPPDYTGLETRQLPPGQGAYSVLAGSTLEVRGTIYRQVEGGATPPLADGELQWGNDTLGPIQINPDDPHQFSITLEGDTLKTGTYGIAMTDINGLRSKRPARFNVKVNPDETPAARVRLEGIGDLVTTRARVPMMIRLNDDYAVTDSAVVYEWGGGLDADIEAIEPVRRPIESVADQYGQPRIDEFEHVFDLQTIDVPLNAHLTFHVEATDNDAISGPKTGKSSTFSLKVVTEEDLRAELLRRETEQRMEFERLLKDQRNLMVDAQALLAGLDDEAERLSAEDWRTFSEIEKKQRLGSGRTEGIAIQFEQILAEVINNRLEEAGGRTQERLAESIIGPLRGLAARDMPAAAELFDRARKANVGPGQRRELLTAAIDQQATVIETMREILKNMVKMEGYQEAINLLREILKSQENISEQTIKELEERIEDIFDD